MHASGETRGGAGEERLREALVAKPVGGGVIRGPDKDSMQPPLAAQLPARPEEALPGAQAPAGGVRPEADEHLPPSAGAGVQGALLVIVGQELRHRGVGRVRVELEVDVVEVAAVASPELGVVRLHVRVGEGRDGGEGDDAAGPERAHEAADALGEHLGRLALPEVLVVHVHPVEAVAGEDGRERRHGVADPGVDGGRAERGVGAEHGVAAEAERDAGVGGGALEGGHGGRGEVRLVPEHGEAAVRGHRRRGGVGGVRGVVDGEGEDEVEVHARVHRHVRERHVLALRADVLAEQRACWRRRCRPARRRRCRGGRRDYERSSDQRVKRSHDDGRRSADDAG
jgi:hypothetical protein